MQPLVHGEKVTRGEIVIECGARYQQLKAGNWAGFGSHRSARTDCVCGSARLTAAIAAHRPHWNLALSHGQPAHRRLSGPLGVRLDGNSLRSRSNIPHN